MYTQCNYGGGGGSTSTTITTKTETKFIKADASITNNSIVNCIYQNLMNPNLNNGLKSILSAFNDNNIYNITFKLEPLSADGRTSYLGGNNWITGINQINASDASYSRIWLASTFIHEAFHAKLRQKAIAILGTDEVQKWPKQIDDMTLAELATYFEKSAQTKNVWNNIGHDWMVNNIDQMATSIREFVQVYYKATYANVGSDLEVYRSLAFMGLSGSTFYAEKVTSDRQSNFGSSLAKLGATGCGN